MIDYPEFVSDFINEVREEMAEQGISTSNLSTLSGINHSALSKLLNKQTMPTVGSICKIADSLRVKVVLCVCGDADV